MAGAVFDHQPSHEGKAKTKKCVPRAGFEPTTLDYLISYQVTKLLA